MTARGHASSFARSNLGDKQIVERATVMEWVEAFGSTESLQVVSVASGSPNSFPDFTAHVDGAHISIELTELLHSKTLSNWRQSDASILKKFSGPKVIFETAFKSGWMQNAPRSLTAGINAIFL